MDEDEKRFIEWLKKQPRSRKFESRSDQYCPLAEYYRELGRVYDVMDSVQWERRFILWFDDVDSTDHNGAMIRNLRGVDHWIDKEIAREIGLFY